MQLIISNTNYTKHEQNICYQIAFKVKSILENSQIKIPDYFPLEISHHYGIDQFKKYGCVIINIINRAYCKKIIIVFPGQENPTHMHKIKEETFQILNGSMILTVNGNNYFLKSGEVFTVERKMSHSFYSKNGCIFEEISTTHNMNDSYYADEKIANLNPAERKTLIKEWQS